MPNDPIIIHVTHSQLGFTIKGRLRGKLGAEVGFVADRLKAQFDVDLRGAVLLRAESADSKLQCNFTQISLSQCRQKLKQLSKNAFKTPFTVTVKPCVISKKPQRPAPSAGDSQSVAPDLPLRSQLHKAPTQLTTTRKTEVGIDDSLSPATSAVLESGESTHIPRTPHELQTVIDVPPDEPETHAGQPLLHAKVDKVLSGARALVEEAQMRWEEEREHRQQLQAQAAMASGPISQHVVLLQHRPLMNSAAIFRAEPAGSSSVKFAWGSSASQPLSMGSRSTTIEARTLVVSHSAEQGLGQLMQEQLRPTVEATRAGASSLHFVFSAAARPPYCQEAAQVEASPAKLAFCSHGVTRLAAAQLLEQSEATSRGSWLQVHCVATGRGGSFDVFGQQATTPNMAEEMTSPFNTQCRAVEVHHLDDLLPLLSLAEESALQHDCQVVWSMALRHPLQRHMQLGCVSIVACKAHSAYTERELIGSVKYGAVAASRWLAAEQREAVKCMLSSVSDPDLKQAKHSGLAQEMHGILQHRPYIHGICVVPSCLASCPLDSPRADCEAWSGGVATSVACLAKIASMGSATASSKPAIVLSHPMREAVSPAVAKAVRHTSQQPRAVARASSPRPASQQGRTPSPAPSPASSQAMRHIADIVDKVREHRVRSLSNVRARLLEKAASAKQAVQSQRSPPPGPPRLESPSRQDSVALASPRSPPHRFALAQSRSSPRRVLQVDSSQQGGQSPKATFAELLAGYRSKYRRQVQS